MSILKDLARVFRRNETKKCARPPAGEAYERLRAKSKSPKAAQTLVKEVLADAHALIAARKRSEDDFNDVVARIRVRDLARKISKDFKNRTI
ncbi:hypothetical protein FHT76_001187 [Rhizobium sp. BK176]|nr:hypothetical protein [Rhizobium sp. BK176]